MKQAGFNLMPGDHAIITVMTGDAVLATRLAAGLMAEGLYVTAFSYPVVPKGKARIRTQMSAAHTRQQLDHAISAFTKVGRDIGLIA